MLTERGLGAALQFIADRAPLPVDLDVQLDVRLAPAHEAALYFTACEALANVTKHADATAASIRAWRDDGRVVIEIADDGVGGAEPMRGSGLRGLTDRLEAVGGHLDVTSAPGRGTTVTATVPALAPE